MIQDFINCLDEDDLTVDERYQLARLMTLLVSREPPENADSDFPAYLTLQERFRLCVENRDTENIEQCFLEFYAHLHMHEAPYTLSERQAMDRAGGYWCHAGGLSPILRAQPFIHQSTISADLGAGNGLQSLLLQSLYPHHQTIQIELSSRMIEIGRRLQDWLEIPQNRVEWITGNLLDINLPVVDFLYLYRPMKPEGVGLDFYVRLADHLRKQKTPTVIFSIADCLGHFLDDGFDTLFGDGHLTAFRRRR